MRHLDPRHPEARIRPVHWNGHTVLAHRLAYEAAHGDIPEEIDGQRAVIDHKCRVFQCVNVAHLELVTNGENILRGATVFAANAGKTHCSAGHEFTPENTGRNSRGNRTCLTCVRTHQENRNAARREMTAANPREPRTHCRHGHEFTPENTRVNTAGARVCKTCANRASREHRARKKTA
ncbi:hypothetical protein GTY54_49370 [Streptomyces sp. SID625]|nr:hypothetical protein [Streptomyces sp. SID625]